MNKKSRCTGRVGRHIPKKAEYEIVKTLSALWSLSQLHRFVIVA